MKTDKDAWLKEYTEFVKSDGTAVPVEIFKSLKSKLFPNP